MSQFNQRLDQAKARQKRLYLLTGAFLPVILLLLTVLFVVSRGTRIEVMPEEAKEQAVIRVTGGLGAGVGDRVYSLNGSPVITVSAPGFKDATATIDAARLGKIFSVELFELPGRLTIDLSGVDENMQKTAWLIDGQEVSSSDSLDVELVPGTYTVTINNPFFQPKEMAVKVKRGEHTALLIELQPVTGVLRLASQPEGATVVLGGQEIGQTPLQVEKNGGLYNLRLAYKNYIDIVEQIEITQTSPEVSRNYKLERQKTRVYVDMMPKGGTLLVDGVQAGQPLSLGAAAEHRVTYIKDGYYPQTQVVLPSADTEKHISFQLKEERGMVEISSSPPATVWIRDRDYGVSPVRIDLPAVAHTVILRKNGYRSVSKTFTPKGGTTQKISAVLLTEEKARLQEAPREYTNQDGIKLRLFVIDDTYTMGAPRSEQGQRANEFQRRVALTKPFYAGVFEITGGQFAKFDPQKTGSASTSPVTSISWQESAAYCNWLSNKEKLQPFYTVSKGQITGFNANADGYRLLSEGEWEWLARKAGKSAQTIFTWGNDTVVPPKAANVADEGAQGQVKFYVPNYTDGFTGVAPVGSFTVEPSGLYDMAGNVSEWVHDVYSIVGPQPNSVEKNPLGGHRGQAHVVKGGNFRSGTITTLRPAFREGLTGGRDDVGLRVGRYLYGGEDG
jgi:formylglycine-generating enzyme required for sulfatase activity